MKKGWGLNKGQNGKRQQRTKGATIALQGKEKAAGVEEEEKTGVLFDHLSQGKGERKKRGVD